MTTRGTARLAWSLAALGPLILIAVIVLSLATGTRIAFTGLFIWAITLAFVGVGGVIASRHKDNAIGWLFLGAGVAAALSTLAGWYARYWLNGGDGPDALGETAAWYGELSWVPWILVPATFLVLLFPDGRLLSRRWRPVAWCAALGIAGAAVTAGLYPGPLSDFPQVNNPYGLESPLVDPLNGLAFLLVSVAIVGSSASLIIRFRRAQGEQREQIKWLAFAGAVAALTIPICTLAYDVMGEHAANIVIMLSVLGLPLATGIAIQRYRLYDIDVVISKTLLVAGLAGFITVAYVAIVVGVGSLFGTGSEPNLALSVAATAVVAVAFQPARRALQRVANRLVYGRRATPYDVLSGFATRVGAAEPSPDRLVELAELLAGGIGADPARVWLRVGSQLRPAATWPASPGADALAAVDVDTAATTALPDTDLAVPVREGGELLGVLTVAKSRGERVTEADRDLLERLAAASGVVLRNLRLDAELTQRLEDLQASRRRLVSAQDDARRRIEADLAGGSRALLSALRDRLSSLAREVEPDATPKTAMLLGQLVTSTDAALDTLAGLAAGVYPPRLAADGLAVALTEQAAKAAVPVSVHAAGLGRYPAEVEAAVYFAVLEALQNVAKYAGGTSAQVRLRHDVDLLSFEVADDGIGFDPTATSMGTGLQGITDRLDTVGGTITIQSSPGEGTTIAGQVATRITAPTAVTDPALVGATR